MDTGSTTNTPQPFNTDATDAADATDDPSNETVPVAIIFVSGLVSFSVLIVLVVITLSVIYFLNRGSKKKKRRRRRTRSNGTGVEDTSSTRHGGESNEQHLAAPALYTAVFREGALQRRDFLENGEGEGTVTSTDTGTTTPALPPPPTPDYPEPREILAYNFDIPQTFRPYPPPPPITGLSDTMTDNVGDTDNPYNVPRYSESHDDLDSVDGSYYRHTTGLRDYSSHRKQLTKEPYYDHVQQSLNRDSSWSLSSSFQPVTMSIRSSEGAEGYYQRPRPATFTRRRLNSDSDHTYNEQLEPSMLQHSTSYDNSESGLPFGPIYDSPRSLMRFEQPLEISRKNIVEIRDLGIGHFGKVALAATTGLTLKDLRLGDNEEKNRSLLVAIKKLKEEADSALKETFQSEIKFMSRLKHANVVRLLGVCSYKEDAFIVMEYMENGDLHEFLLKQTLVPDTVRILGDNEATPLILLYITVQIASGMRYLASKKFIHRDLATRNCLMGRDFVVKISDFGMSRNLYESFYYRVQGRLILPIRWMAYESFYGKFSTKSDAWSFGITLWEIYSMAKHEPYREMNDEEFICDAIKGAQRRRLEKPEVCPREVYDVMQRCWVHEPNMRSDFEEIYSRLFLIYTTKCRELV